MHVSTTQPGATPTQALRLAQGQYRLAALRGRYCRGLALRYPQGLPLR